MTDNPTYATRYNYVVTKFLYQNHKNGWKVGRVTSGIKYLGSSHAL
jgi:hypothetical protein